MSSAKNIVIYLKMAVKNFRRHPGFDSIRSSLKYYSSWKEHLKIGKNSVSDKNPWISFSAIDFMKEILHPNMTVFEYGSGGSTLFWASRVKKVISVEHDKVWYEKMKLELALQQIKNIDYFLIEPKSDPMFSKKDYKNPNDYISLDKDFEGKQFEAYVKKIDEYADDSFDVIIVDGRSRPSCVQHSLKKLKLGGYLVVDNTERSYYLDPFHFDGQSWSSRIFSGPVPYIYHFSDTTIIKKLN